MRRALVLGWALLLALALVGCQPAGSTTSTRSPLATATSTSQTGVDPESGLPIVALADLPPEAATTVALIENGGPYPYSQDGAVFQNREGILPDQPGGY